jgi:hypothetical protein
MIHSKGSRYSARFKHAMEARERVHTTNTNTDWRKTK